jgi:hypothetical protein
LPVIFAPNLHGYLDGTIVAPMEKITQGTHDDAV